MHYTGTCTCITQVHVHALHRYMYMHYTGTCTCITQVHVHALHRYMYMHYTGTCTCITQVHVHALHRYRYMHYTCINNLFMQCSLLSEEHTLPISIPEMPEIVSMPSRFEKKQESGYIDVWWLYDDGGENNNNNNLLYY